MHEPDLLLQRELARAVGDLADGYVDALLRLARVLRGMEVAQGVDTGARDLPALAPDERGAAPLGHLEVGRGAVQSAHGVAVASEGVLDRAGEIAPGHRTDRFEGIGDTLGARCTKLPPACHGTDDDEG